MSRSTQAVNITVIESNSVLSKPGTLGKLFHETLPPTKTRFVNTAPKDIAWPRKVDPILDNLTLDRLVLDLRDSFCGSNCTCRKVATAIPYFEEGFTLQAPKVVQIKGWDAGRADVEVMVRDCSRVWTLRRARYTAGYAGLASDTDSEAAEWLLDVARGEQRKSNE